MRREDLYLRDIVEAAEWVARFVEGMTEDQFLESELVRSAAVQKLTVIGEAAGRVSKDLASWHPEVPWPIIVAFRNILVHSYFGVDTGMRFGVQP